VATITLVLFDIDGTLIHSAGAGLRGMETAFAERHGRTDALAQVPIAGRTDRAIVEDVFERMGLPFNDAEFLALRERYLEYLPLELSRVDIDGKCVLPGVAELLDALEAKPSVAMGLLTGNFVEAAAIKLAHFDLWRRFAFGAFGDTHVSRADLVPVALARARERGLDVGPDRTVVIGDTPLDVECARAHGAAVIAVASGVHSLDDLAVTTPDLLVESLADARVFDWLERVDRGEALR
jgi:phosphoglycolate phosphatase-like HAD superfamily hydrolase